VRQKLHYVIFIVVLLRKVIRRFYMLVRVVITCREGKRDFLCNVAEKEMEKERAMKAGASANGVAPSLKAGINHVVNQQVRQVLFHVLHTSLP
jgi:hypothetical protein